MRRFVGAFAVLGLLAAGAVLAQDAPVTIKLKKAGPGDTVRETKTEKANQKVTVNGMAQPGGGESVATYAYTEKVIERPTGAAKPTKVERTYEVAELTTPAGKEDLGLKGKTVHVEKKGDKFEFTIEGKPLGGKAADLLGKEFGTAKQTTDEDFLPNKPVKVGETWKIDVAKVAGELAETGMVVDNAKSSATGKLVKVYDKDGKKFGVMEVSMDLAVTKLKGPGQEIPLKDGSKLHVDLTLDGCIDGTEASGSGKMTMKGDLSGTVMGAALGFDINVDMTSKSEEQKK